MLETKRATCIVKLLIERTMCSLQGSSVIEVPPRIHIPRTIVHSQFEANQSFVVLLVSSTIPQLPSDYGHTQLIWPNVWHWWEVIQHITTANYELTILTNYFFPLQSSYPPQSTNFTTSSNALFTLQEICDQSIFHIWQVSFNTRQINAKNSKYLHFIFSTPFLFRHF